MRTKNIIVSVVAVAFIAFCVVSPANAIIDPITIGLILGAVFVAMVAGNDNQNDTAKEQDDQFKTCHIISETCTGK